MFQIKICGIQNLEDAKACAAGGVDAIGLNFYEKSRRFVDPQMAQHIAKEVSGSIQVIGLFVNHRPEEVAEICSKVNLSAIQLHGNERPEWLGGFNKLTGSTLKVVRAIRVSAERESDAAAEINEWVKGDYRDQIGAILLDTFQADSFGGTGKRLDWSWLSESSLLQHRPVILAGGLNPDNVSDAISRVRPDGVDVAGGVEVSGSSKVSKDIPAIEAFVQAARAQMNNSKLNDR